MHNSIRQPKLTAHLRLRSSTTHYSLIPHSNAFTVFPFASRNS